MKGLCYGSLFGVEKRSSYEDYGVKNMSKITSFFKESRQELKKVVWPSKEQVAVSTRVVIISVIVFALTLGLVDYILLQLLYKIF